MLNKKIQVFFILLMLNSAFVFANDVFNVRDFGASGNRSQNATPAMQKAIDAARMKGGGTVLVPFGEYTCLPLTLYSNITLQIEAGAMIFVDLKHPDFKGQSFIYAENAKNITIKGKGTIDGQATYVYEDMKGTDPEIKEEIELARAAGVEMKRYYRSPGKSAFTLLLKECEDLTIEGVTLINSSLWCMRIWGSNRVTIRNVTIVSSLEKGVNSDGIDIDGSSNVHISGCNITAGDDAICIKTGAWRFDGKGKIYASENIVVDNCILSSSSAALKLGTESYGDMRHIVFSNCVVRNANKGIEINIQDGARVEDIIFTNLTMELKRRHWNWWGDAQPFNFSLRKRNDSSKIGSIKNIQVSNITAHAQGTSRIRSRVNHPIENITVSNMKLFMEAEATPDKRTSNGMHFTNVSGLNLKDIEIYWAEDKTEPKWKSSVVLQDVSNFKLQGIQTRQAIKTSDDPAIVLSDCMNGFIYNCVALPGSKTFLRITGKKTEKVVLANNFFNNAAKALVIEKEVRAKEVLQR